jgi:hypothetical protein
VSLVRSPPTLSRPHPSASATVFPNQQRTSREPPFCTVHAVTNPPPPHRVSSTKCRQPACLWRSLRQFPSLLTLATVPIGHRHRSIPPSPQTRSAPTNHLSHRLLPQHMSPKPTSRCPPRLACSCVIGRERRCCHADRPCRLL